MLGSVNVSNPTTPISGSSTPEERVGRSSATNSRNASPAGSRSNSRARDLLHKVTHMGAPQDWAAQSLGTPDVHAAPAVSVEDRVGRTSGSRDASPSTSRSNSRARDLLHKVTHMGAPQDWAAQSLGTPDLHTPPSGEDRVGRASREASPNYSRSNSRSNSRARSFLNQITHMGAGGSDWAAHSLGTPDLHIVANGGEERSGRSSRGASPAGSRSASRSQSRVRSLLDKATHMGAGGSDWAAHSMGTPDVHGVAPAVIKEEAVAA